VIGIKAKLPNFHIYYDRHNITGILLKVM